MSYQPCSQYTDANQIGNNNFTCRTEQNKELSCFMYFDHLTSMIQRRCVCEPGYQVENKDAAINGCGPESLIGKSTEKNFMTQLLDQNTTKCCVQHDVCMSKTADSGKCAHYFSQCLSKVPDNTTIGVFTRNLLDHFVKTSSHTFLRVPEAYQCTRITHPRLHTLQETAQQQQWDLLNPIKPSTDRWWW